MNCNPDQEQLHHFWMKVAEQVKKIILDSRKEQKQLWVSTCGTDVSWLHVRLDSNPKLYSFEPYKPYYLAPEEIPQYIRDRSRSKSRSRSRPRNL